MASISGPTQLDLADGKTATYTASGSDTSSAEWSIDTAGDTYAYVQETDGGRCVVELTGEYGGSFTLTYRDSTGDSGSITVSVVNTVEYLEMTSLTANSTSLSMTGGETTYLYLTYSPADATETSVSISRISGLSGVSYSSRVTEPGTIRLSITPTTTDSGTASFYVHSSTTPSVRTQTITAQITPGVTITGITIDGPDTVDEGTTHLYSALYTPGGEGVMGVDWDVGSGGSIVHYYEGSEGSRVRVTFSGTTSPVRISAVTDSWSATKDVVVNIEPEPETIPTTSVTASTNQVTLEVGQSTTVTVTRSPSDTTDEWSFTTDYYNTGGLRYFGSSRTISGNTFTLTITAHDSRTGSGGYVRVRSGDIYTYIYVTVTGESIKVSDIRMMYAYSTMMIPGESTHLQALAIPANAPNRNLTASIVQGSSYVTLTQEKEEWGCDARVQVNSAPSSGTATVRVRFTADDGGGYYEDFDITVAPIRYANNLTIAPSSGTLFVGEDATPGRVWGLNDETCTMTVISGASCISLTYSSDGLFYVSGIAAGTAIVRATANTSGATATATYTVSDEYPHTGAITVEMYYGEYAFKALELDGWILHGGYDTVELQEGISWMSTTTFLPFGQSQVAQRRKAGPNGTPTELGDRILFATDPEQGTTTKVTISVIQKGSYAKTIHFEPRTPDGTYLVLPVPEDVVALYTDSAGTPMTIPEQEPTCEGYIFCYWEADDESVQYLNRGPYLYSDSPVTVTGEDVTVTLSAVWFPVLDWCTCTSTRNSFGIDVEMDIPVHATLTADIPNLGMVYPSRYPFATTLRSGSITGITVRKGSSTISLSGYTLTSGNLSLVGEPTRLGDVLTFYTRDSVGHYVNYTVTVVDGPVLPDDGEGTVVFDANGGSFPNGQERVTLSVPDGSYVLPDWSVVDHPGHRLTGWTGTYSGSASMGSVQDTEERWIAQWAVDARGYDTENLPHAAIRIYRTLDQYLDATYLQVQGGEAIIQVAENEAGMASFTLLNDYQTAGSCLLSEGCTLWSSGGAGPIETGMYVRIDDVKEDGSVQYAFDGFITTLSPNAETVSVECGDRLTFLGRGGTTYRRNFYGSSRTSALFPAGHDSSGMYADVSDMPDGSYIDGALWWKVEEGQSFSGSNNFGILSWGSNGERPSSTIVIPTDHDRVESLTLPLDFNGAQWPGTYTWVVRAMVRSGDNMRGYTWDVSTSAMGNETRTFQMDLGGVGLDISGGTLYIDLYLEQHTGNRGGVVLAYYSSGGTLDVRYPDGSALTDVSINLSVTWSDWHEVTSRSAASNGKIYVTKLDGVTSLDDSDLWTPSENRVRIPYITGTQAVLSIARSMAWGLGYIPMPAPDVPDADLQMFRTGGGYALDYLQKLADVAGPDGRTRAFTARGYTTPVLIMTSRHKLADASSAHIHYGGDSVADGGESIAFSAFAPSMTFKHRPSIATVRGTMSSKGDTESRPIIVAIEDTSSTSRRYGLAVETVIADSTVNLALDAASSAWGVVTESDLDEWEGSVTIPGIRRDLIPPAGTHGGSGVPLTLTDTRDGIKGARARARQIRLDYNACTTQITLTNHSLQYSSGIADTAALAVTSADVATGDTSTTLFNTQYVRVVTETTQRVASTGNVVKGLFGDCLSEFTFPEVAVLQLPNGRSVLVATAPADPDSPHAADDRPYDVISVSINGGAPIPIRKSLRPDYYPGQTLIINVDFPTS